MTKTTLTIENGKKEGFITVTLDCALESGEKILLTYHLPNADRAKTLHELESEMWTRVRIQAGRMLQG